MQDKQRKEIVDSQGNAYKSTRDSKVKQFEGSVPKFV